MENINWIQIKAWIKDNTKRKFHAKTLSNEKAIDLLVDVILAPVDEEKLSGIPELFPIALQRMIVERKDFASHFCTFAHVEKLLKKILYMVNPEKFESIKNLKEGLIKVIESLGLNKNKLNLSSEILSESQKKNYGEHLQVAYELRNAESHWCENLSELELLNMLASVLIVYLFAIDEHCSSITAYLNSRDTGKAKYLDEIQARFKIWNQRFVPTNGLEQFKEIPLYAIEAPSKKGDEKRKMREGEIEQLRKELISDGQRQMIIIGEAGIGKTTTMKYLSYRDSKNGKFPIYVELKLLTLKDSIESVINQKVKNISGGFGKLMHDKNTCIFLDGLNEILPSIKDSILREIKSLITNYPNPFFVISTRQGYASILSDIPIFMLQKMDISKIELFLKKNTDRIDVRDTILTAIRSNKEWERILGTPLILFMLISIVSMGKAMPDDQKKIIIQFIYNLYAREKEKDNSFDSEYFHGIICHIAFECIDSIGSTNSGFSFADIKKLLTGKASLSDKELNYILNKGVELNLLVKDANLYSFSHQSYQETLAGDYFNTMLYEAR